jgi:hypothetical protein
VGEALATALDQRGQHSILISDSDSDECLSATRFRLKLGRADDVRRVFEQIEECQGLVYLADCDAPEFTPAESCEPVLHILHELARRDWPVPPRLWLITHNAQLDDAGMNVAQSALWGLGRVIAEEQREHWGGLFD